MLEVSRDKSLTMELEVIESNTLEVDEALGEVLL